MQGLELSTDRQVHCFPNYIQRVSMDNLELKEGKNESAVQLRLTRNKRMETLIPILYEICKKS